MAKSKWVKLTHTGVKKSSSQGVGGRGRSVKIAMSTMNKSKKDRIKNTEDKVDDNNQYYECY